MSVRVIISDFGGVLTNPLEEAFLAYQEESGIALEELGLAMFSVAERDGENPLYVLEKGQMTYARFEEVMQDQLRVQLGDEVQFSDFTECYFNALHPNQQFLDFLFDYKAGGGRLALLTNNVKEWEPRWRAMLPIDELFETIVDSGFVGTRKPEPRIYEIAYEQIKSLPGLHDVARDECVLVDDIEINCDAAREFGFQAVRYHEPFEVVRGELNRIRSQHPA
ncbi:MAG: HAD-IA family hydrolase [Solirubrobacterales bacterium]